MSRGARLRAVLLVWSAGACALAARAQQPAADGWRPFKATWTLSGQRSLLATEGERPASIVHLTGPLTVTAGKGLGRGLLGEVIGFDDGRKLVTARAVFTDEHGDRIYCVIEAEPIGTGRRATATMTGGTGGFAALEGSFTFAWQYVVDAGTDEISGATFDLEGRTRGGAAAHSGSGP